MLNMEKYGMCRCFYTRPLNSVIVGGSNRANNCSGKSRSIDRTTSSFVGKFGEVLRGRLADDEEKKILCEKDLRLARIGLVSIS
jgi:hypothetical protein